MCACLVLNYCWFNRADTSVRLQRRHISFSRLGITINVQGKTIARNVAHTVHRRTDFVSDPDNLVAGLISRWFLVSASWQKPDSPFWSLYAAESLPAPIVTSWLNECSSIVGISPAFGETWTAHSLRSGGASACQAIDVPLFYIMAFGVWKTMAAIERYLSALILPSDAAWLFFGWLRPNFTPTPIRKSL